MDHDRNLMLFLNIDSFCFSSRRVSDSLKSIKIHLGGEQTGFLPTPISPFLESQKIVGDGNFVDRIFLYRT